MSTAINHQHVAALFVTALAVVGSSCVKHAWLIERHVMGGATVGYDNDERAEEQIASIAEEVCEGRKYKFRNDRARHETTTIAGTRRRTEKKRRELRDPSECEEMDCRGVMAGPGIMDGMSGHKPYWTEDKTKHTEPVVWTFESDWREREIDCQ